MRIAHFAVNFRSRNKSGNRVNNYNINRPGTNKLFGYLKRLFTVVRLRNKKRININAEIYGINRVERMLCVNKSRDSAGFLAFGNTVKREGRFT